LNLWNSNLSKNLN